MKDDNPSQGRYVLVAESALPEVFTRVLEAKAMLADGGARNVSAAVKAVGLSRSAFYKYKDCVFPARAARQILTAQVTLLNEPGTLQSLLARLSEAGADVVTIHQQKPHGDEAQVMLTINVSGMRQHPDELFAHLRKLPAVRSMEISED